MIDLESLNFGDTIFRASRAYNFDSDKITKIDDDGIAWHRYSGPRYVSQVHALNYCGLSTVEITGEVRFNEDKVTEYYFKNENGYINVEDIEHNESEYFYSEQSAKQSIKDREE